MSASSITIVTKNTSQSYTGGITVSAKGTALSVLEVDSNFINLKEGIITLEGTVNSNYSHFTSEITNVTNYVNTEIATLTSYVNTNFVNSTSPSLSGVPTSPDPGGSGSSQIQTVGGVNLVVNPISAIVNDSSTGNAALYNLLTDKAPLASPQLTGFPRLTGSSYNFSTWDGVTQYLAPVEYVQDKLENLSGDVKPTSAGGADLGTATEHFNELHVNAILPAGSNATIGTPTNRFPFGYFDTGDFGPNTILVGDAEISADGSTLVVPVNTAIGDQDNVLPLNIASTVVDKRFGELSLTQALDQTFTASGAIAARDPVAINADGTVSTISSTVSNLNYVGIALSSAADAGTLSVRVHGEVSGFTGLTDGDTVFVENDGSLVQTKTTTALKIGTAVSATEILCFTTSNLDTYLLNIKKTELGDFSASNASTASGTGGISYDSATGQFTFTPADTASFATTSYVDTEIANLVNSAPTSLDTLDELAAALNDDANFASTVTNSIATKAPLASPALTGTPTAPTASSGTNTTQIATTAYVQSELSGLGNASLNSFSVSTGSASGGGSLAYNNTNGVFTFAPADLSNVLTSYTETDPVVGAINGIVKADGNGNISAAVAGTDYSTFDGAFSSLTSKPTTISGYGITDAVPLASPAFTGTPTAPTASSGTNTTQLATTAFVQSAVTGSSGIALTDLSVTTNTANAGGALSYNDATGVFTFVPADQAFSALTGKPTTISGYGITDAFDGAFSSLTGKPTTISGYGITDAAPLASPTFTGTPAAPTAASGTNTTQLATTAFVQGEISGFSTSGGDSQIDFIADGAITSGTAVTLGSTTGEVTAVSTAPIAATHVRLVNSSNNQHYYTQKGALDYNDQDGVYQQFYQNVSGQTVGVIWNTNLGGLTFTAGSEQTLLSSLTPDNYFHINGTSTGILRIGTNSYVVTNSSGTLSIGSANNVGAYSKIITTENGDLIALNGSNCYFVTVSGTTITFGSAIAIGLTPDYGAFEWSKQYDKVVAASLSSGTVTYSIGTISGTNITWSTAATNTTWASNGNQLFYHVGSEMLISSRRNYWAVSQPVDLKMRSSTFNGSAFAFASNAETTVLSMGPGNNNGNHYILAHTIKCSKTDDKFGILVKQDNAHVYKALASVSSSGVFANELGATLVVDRDYGTTSDRFPAGENDPEGYLAMVSSDRDTYPSNNSNIFTSFFRTSASSTKSSYLGIAQSTVADGDTVTVMLAGAISDVHSSLTPDTTMYVQDNGTISNTVSTVIAGKALNASSIQVADSRGTFDKPITFSTITGKPTTLSGYGITDGASTLSDIDIGSNDFITTGKSYFANMFATTGDLPSATTYHGMFAHVHGTGAGYFAHAGNWVELANKSYVDTEVANLVNSAPATLDTLDELAAALNDDANFATTVTTSLAAKAPLVDPALTGTPTAPTAASGTNSTQIATTAFVQAAVGSSSSSPLSISYTPDVKYARLELTANQSITSTTNTVVNFNTRSVDSSTNNLLTSTLGSGKFIIPAGVSKVRLKASARTDNTTDQVILKILKNGSNAVSTNFDIDSTGGDFPAAFTGIESVTQGDYFQVSIYSQASRTVETSDHSWFEIEVLEGSILNQTVAGNVSIDDLSDVDTTTSTPTDGQALVWNNSASEWRPGTVATSGGASVTTSDAAPSSPSAGDLWYNTDAGGLFLYYTDADSSQWVEVVGKTGPTGATGAAGGSTITVSDAAPSSPVAGQLWWNSTSNKLYIYYTDANSSQWVQATTPGADGAAGAAGATGAAGASPGRNKFINGNFDVWQRGTSTTSSGFAADRWRLGIIGNSQCTFSQQSFTLGQTDVPFNPKYYQRAVATAGSDANSYVLFNQRIEDVRTFQGETVTVSFWAKADSAKDIAVEPYQFFGSTGTGGSAGVPVTPQTVTLSTTWTKYTKTFSIPSITGKTLGTSGDDWLGFFFWLDAGSDWNSRTGSLGNQSGTFDFAQIQVERGSIATDFETEYYTDTLRKCQRYYYEYPRGETYSFIATGYVNSTSSAHVLLQYPQRMRAAPTQTSTGSFQILERNTGHTVTAFQLVDPTVDSGRLTCTTGAYMTLGGGCALRNLNDANATIMLNAEI